MKYIGEDIGDEVDVHMNLLGDLDKSVDSTNDKLMYAAKKAEELIQKSSNGCLMCIIILLVTILFVIILYF